MSDTYVRESLYDRIASDSNVVGGDEYRELICAVAQVASDMVVKTLGPYGSTTVIDDGSGMTYPSKDGWACLSRLQFTDPTYNTIFAMLKKISFNSVTTVGDGTTTAMVAATNFLNTMYKDFMPKATKKGPFRQADFIASMNSVAKKLEESLTDNEHMKTIDHDGDFEDIYKIAYVATNGNEYFAKLIQEIYQKTHNPNIQVVLDRSLPRTKGEVQTGYRFEARTISFRSYVNDASNRINYKNHPVRLVVFDHNVTYQMHAQIITGLSNMSSRDNVTTVILAPYFDDIIASMIMSAVNRMIQDHQIPNIVLVQVPTVMQLHQKTLSDLAIITGGQIFDEAKVKAFNILRHNATHGEDDQIKDDMFSIEQYAFKSPEEILKRCIGIAKSLVITKDEGFIQEFENSQLKEYQNILKEATEDYEEAKKKAVKTMGGTLDKEYLFKQMRYIKLHGSTGVIKVGGMSDLQARCDKDALDDAVLACRSAYENGYVRGMNLELLSILNGLLQDNWVTNDTARVYDSDVVYLLFKSFYLTSIQVLRNKHPDDEVKRNVTCYDNNCLKVEPGVNVAPITYRFCNKEILDTLIQDGQRLDYNLRTETMHAAGSWEVINSTATDIEILRAVVNVLTTVITSNQFLSVTRRFDPIITEERTIRHQMETDSRLMRNKVNTIIDAIAKHPDYDLMQGLIGGITIAGELDTFTEEQESDPTASPFDVNQE